MNWKRMSMVAAGMVSMVSMSGCPTGPSPAGLSGTISCGGGSGVVAVSPAVDAVPKPITYSLVSPTADVGCDDGTGNGITAASIAAFSVRFPSLSCSVTSGTTGRGRATIDWSDGTESTATAVATLEGALNGTVELRVVSGHFEGASTTTWFVATPLEGECFGSGITRESIEIGALALTPR